MKTNKVAIVTGGNAGLGFAIAKKLCAENIRTYIIGRNEEKTKLACEALGTNANYILHDLTDLSKIPDIIHHIKKKEGHIDILINNAGINMKKDFFEVTTSEFQDIIHTNLTSVFVISREVASVMQGQLKGSIVNISSMAAIYGIPQVPAYSASKAAIEGLTRSMAVDLAPYGIRVNCVAPGFIKTNMSSKALDNDPDRKHKVLSRTPLNKLGEPSDIAEAVFYYASEAAKYTTGTILPIDGGNSIGF
ncbi:3-oxoacyl-ACP reductase [Neptunitalea chrysea]|uniref:3-oxoacyl-ACP reductase n=1 Tax=Neptunitalea chrysea TaxID=1647581 RepID=A0A9W6B4U2_9FLAO|nr:SDR family oxidoreductase [Neptunitalea chrysea]GLB51872.1 3-oxoacyl-ACP reductase [Neptunitalea chrysea]